MEKQCTYCKKKKDITKFSKQKHGKYGVKGRCKKCCKKLLEQHNHKCLYCKKEFLGRKDTIFCSNKCKWKSYKNNKKRSFKISLSKLNNKNSMWKGNDVGYNALHAWIKRNYKKPKLCECCKKVPPYDLANKEIYNRDIKNWEWLCRRCHMIKDGRINNLKQFNK